MKSSIAGPPAPLAASRLVRALAIATFLQWLGASTVLPILPLYLRTQGASDNVIGVAMAAFFAAGVIVQYPVGRLSDRIGQTRVLVVALGCFAVASAGYLLPVGPWPEVALRALQGAGAGAAEVASLALVGRYVPEGRRGSAYGAIFGAQLASLAIGPLLGSIVGVGYIRALFIGSGVAACIAVLPVLSAAKTIAAATVPDEAESTTESTQESAPATSGIPAVRLRLLSVRALQGCLVVAIIAGLSTGVYESCWTLLLHSRGAHSWQIGLSWSMFCVPFVAMSVPAGRLADRFDRRVLVIGSLALSVILLPIYPVLPSIAAMVTLGALEGVGVAIAYPAAQALLSQLSPVGQVGQIQGMFSTVQTAAIAIAAASGGALFSIASWLPFASVSVLCALLLIALPTVWKGVPGRSPAAGPVNVELSPGDAMTML